MKASRKLRVDNVDLLLLHWPAHEVPVAKQIELINEVQAAGKTRLIGVSNQNIAQMRESVETSVAPIITNQVEVHPYLDQSKLVAAARELDVAITGYYGMADGAVPKRRSAAADRCGVRQDRRAGRVALDRAAGLCRTVQDREPRARC